MELCVAVAPADASDGRGVLALENVTGQRSVCVHVSVCACVCKCECVCTCATVRLDYQLDQIEGHLRD
jgi:hypothetical protein